MNMSSDKISIIYTGMQVYTIQSCIPLHVHAITQNKQVGHTLDVEYST